MDLKYSFYAGVFDTSFTEQDYKILIVVLLTWLIKMYILRKNVLTKTPHIDDYVSTLIIQYLVTGLFYELIIYLDYSLALFIFPLTIFGIFSSDFILYIAKDEETKNKLFKTIFELLTSKLTKLLNLFK